MRETMANGKQRLVNLAAAREKAHEKAAKAREGRKAKAATWSDVKGWFVTARDKHMPQLRVLPSWTVKDRVNAKRMLEEFGEEMTRDAVFFVWEHWSAYQSGSGGRLNGIPSPSLLYAMRSQVFTDVQLGRIPGKTNAARSERIGRDEYNADRDATGTDDPFGWGM